MQWMRASVIILALICVMGVLILPQVDLPDFVVPSARIFMPNFAHATVSLWAMMRSHGGKTGALFLPRRAHLSNVGQLGSLERCDEESLLSQLCTHRC